MIRGEELCQPPSRVDLGKVSNPRRRFGRVIDKGGAASLEDSCREVRGNIFTLTRVLESTPGTCQTFGGNIP